MKYLMRERVFGIGDDHWITTEHGDKVFLVDGKALAVRETFVLKDPYSHQEVAKIQKKMLAVRDTMRVEQGGETVATVKKKFFTPFRDKYEARLADGRELEIHGDFTDHEFDIEDGGRRIARVSRKWFSVRDTYAIEVADDQDVALLLCIAVCVDVLNAEEHHHHD